MFMTAPVVGALSRKIDPRIVIFTGLLGFAWSSWMLTPITADWEFNELLLPQAIRGASLMMCMIPINLLALGTLPLNELKNASGLFNLMRNLGGAFGLAAINTLLTNRTDFHYARLGEHVTWGRPMATEKLALLTRVFEPSLGDVGGQVALGQVVNIVRRQALVMSFADVFLVLAIMFAAMVLMVGLLGKPVRAGGGPSH